MQQYKGFVADSPNVRLVPHVRLVAAQSCDRRTIAATNRFISKRNTRSWRCKSSTRTLRTFNNAFSLSLVQKEKSYFPTQQ